MSFEAPALSSNFPLSCAYSLNEYDRLRWLIESGAVTNYNEIVYPRSGLLCCLITCPSVDPELIEIMIDRGAEVNFAPGSKYPNAYICAQKGRKTNPLPLALMNKIKSKLNSEQLALLK